MICDGSIASNLYIANINKRMKRRGIKSVKLRKDRISKKKTIEGQS